MEAVFDFDYWHSEATGSEADAVENTLSLSIPSVWTARVAQDMGECGLVGQVLDGLPLAMARAVALGSPGLTEPVIAIDWGYRNATLCVVRRGRPVFVRALRDCGFAGVLSAVSGSLDLSADEAQKLLRDWGLPDCRQPEAAELQTVIEEVVGDPLAAFTEELARTIAFLRQQRQSIAPAKLLLLGGGAAVRNMAAYLSGKLELPVEMWRLGGPHSSDPSLLHTPIEMLGPAIALSSLAWAST
jgi:Tfp pilus assembly PilM family ATPase